MSRSVAPPPSAVSSPDPAARAAAGTAGGVLVAPDAPALDLAWPEEDAAAPAREPSPSLDDILRRTPQIWRGRGGGAAREAVLATGFAELDAAIGGWPRAALTELVVAAWGIGELRLLLPAMRATLDEGRPLAWIEPPFVPYAPALAAAGLDLDRLLLVAGLAGDRDLWWTLETLLRSGAAGLVLAWPRRPGSVTVLRRLQLAAAEGRALGLLLAPAHPSGTPAALRLHLAAADGGLWVRVLKQRGLPETGAVQIRW